MEGRERRNFRPESFFFFFWANGFSSSSSLRQESSLCLGVTGCHKFAASSLPPFPSVHCAPSEYDGKTEAAHMTNSSHSLRLLFLFLDHNFFPERRRREEGSNNQFDLSQRRRRWNFGWRRRRKLTFPSWRKRREHRGHFENCSRAHFTLIDRQTDRAKVAVYECIFADERDNFRSDWRHYPQHPTVEKGWKSRLLLSMGEEPIKSRRRKREESDKV